jgi:hypothetical protein
MESADGVAHSHAPVSEGSEAGEVTIHPRRGAFAGPNRFETFHGLGIHAFNSGRSEMGDQAFGGNSVSLVRSRFDVVARPREKPVKGNIEFKCFAVFKGLFRVREARDASFRFQPQCLGFIG